MKAAKKLQNLQHIHLSEEDKKSRFGAVRGIINQIMLREGVAGFYKGYFVSLACFAPNSALWWFFYDSYSSEFKFIPHISSFYSKNYNIFY